MLRDIFPLALFVVGLAVPLRGAQAQDSTAPPDWLSLVRDGDRPDYMKELDSPEPPAVPIPRPPPGEAPAVVRGLYVNGWVFGSSRFYDLVALAESTEVNALVIDVKDGTGHMTYRSNVPTAIQAGANNMIRAPDVRQRLALLNEKGIHPIARIVVAKDPLLARHKPEWGVRDVDGGQWRDRLGDTWVDAYNDSIWIYAAEIAEEAVLLGFREVQFDYIRFPDEPPELLDRAVFPARRPNESRRAAIRRNLKLLRDRVKPLGVPFTVDVFGLTTSATSDMGIGQHWDDITRYADVVLPMIYPSHYYRGAYGYERPNFHPYEIVKRALDEGVARSRKLGTSARIRPYLQAFSIRGKVYRAAEVRAEIQAVEDAGLTDWILWNARGVYPAGAFRTVRDKLDSLIAR